MARKSGDARRRLQILMDLWLKIVGIWETSDSDTLDRDEVVKMLKEAYITSKIEPLRGASLPSDIYDKELTSLYVVGKYGMGLDRQYPELFDKIFSKEIKYEEALKVILASEANSSKIETILNALLGSLSDNDLARMLRIKLTQVYFGFAPEEELIEAIRSIYEKLPDRRRLAVKYARFYIAFKIASAIAQGEIRNRIVKEVMKQASALNLSNIHGVIPDDSYIAAIAKNVFGVSDRTLRTILSMSSKDRGGRGERGERESTEKEEQHS